MSTTSYKDWLKTCYSVYITSAVFCTQYTFIVLEEFVYLMGSSHTLITFVLNFVLNKEYINTLQRTGDADLRFYVTTVQDG